jgi:hypothetical protein
MTLPLASVAGLGVIHYPIYKRWSRHAIALSLLAIIVWLLGCHALNSLIQR